jgi:hypothetical protein
MKKLLQDCNEKHLVHFYTRRIRKVSTVRLFKKKTTICFQRFFFIRCAIPYTTFLPTIIEVFVVTGYQFLCSLVVERSRL